jgi:hypothetical protein
MGLAAVPAGFGWPSKAVVPSIAMSAALATALQQRPTAVRCIGTRDLCQQIGTGSPRSYRRARFLLYLSNRNDQLVLRITRGNER